MKDTSDRHDGSGSALRNAITRRDFLKGAAGLSASATAAVALAGCGSSAKPAPPSKPKAHRGGRLRAGITGGGSSDTLDAQAGVNDVDFARIPQLNEPLNAFDHNGNVVPWLAEEMTPNADASEWTIRVRDGITFHDGKPLQAEDVIFSFQRILNPKAPLPGASSLTPLDINAMKKLDARTARFTCHTPFATFPQVQPASYFFIVPVGYNPKSPVGTGPFKYESFEPGVQSVFTRNENYWINGRPYVDEVVIVDYADPTTQVNALMAKDIDCANLDTVSIVPELRTSGIQVLISTTGFMTPFTMRADVAPFSDVRVRQAMRLAVDRPQMRGAVFDGDGLLGNDIFSPFDPAYDKSIPQRQQDIAQAKSLLKQAGHDPLNVQLVTSDISPGTINAAQALKQQVSAAGINVQLRQVTPSEFFGSNYLQWTFSQDYWTYIPYLVQCSESMIKGAAFSETKFANPRYNDLYRQALSIVDDTKRADVIHEMMMIDYNEGTYIIPYFLPAANGYGSNVRGATYDKTGVTLAQADFKDLWFE